MTSKERVLTTISHQEPDRVPLDVWIFQEEKVIEKWGSLDRFYEALNTDMFLAYTPSANSLSRAFGSIDEVLDSKFCSPDDEKLYTGFKHEHGLQECGIKESVRKYGDEKAIFGEVIGVFENAQSFLGIENLLMEMALHKEKVKELFKRLSAWLAKVAENVTDLGVDVLQISDDWGENKKLLFSPKDWWELIYPNDKRIADVGKKKGLPISLHSDGYIWEVMDGIVKMGINVIHPVQASAGMDHAKFKEKYGNKLCLYGGLDITHTLPYGTEEEIINEVKREMEILKPGGGFIFCTSHAIQPDTDLSKVEIAYKVALMYGKY